MKRRDCIPVYLHLFSLILILSGAGYGCVLVIRSRCGQLSNDGQESMIGEILSLVYIARILSIPNGECHSALSKAIIRGGDALWMARVQVVKESGS
jgi:hypothetical protein